MESEEFEERRRTAEQNADSVKGLERVDAGLATLAKFVRVPSRQRAVVLLVVGALIQQGDSRLSRPCERQCQAGRDLEVTAPAWPLLPTALTVASAAKSGKPQPP